MSAVRVREVEGSAALELSVVPRPRALAWPKAALAGIYVAAVAYHWLQSRAHVTPAVFADELLYSKLAQSLAAGHGFVVRGAAVSFPAPLAVLLQVPAWLVHSTPTAYALVKALNVVTMSAAVFPAYCLARRLVRPSYALLAAAATVAGPVMLYAPYLMSEALAYPVFLLAGATMLRAIERPSRRMEAAVVAVCLAAALTRVQFVVLPVAYLTAVVAVRELRRHAFSLGALLALGAVPLIAGLGTYTGAASLHYHALAVLRWGSLTGALLPFVAGWLVVPGAIMGLALLLMLPRSRAERGFAAFAIASILLVLLEVGLVGAADAARPMERYAIYLVPLALIAFFAYAERGAPWRKAYGALALAGGLTAWLLDFPVRAGTAFSFDTATYSMYGQTAHWLGHPNAATIFAAVPFLGGIALALLPLGRPRVATGVGVATIALLLAGGAAAYAGDHALTRGTLAARAGDPPDWLDRSGLGPADFLELPGGSAHYGWLFEAWNRGARRAIELGVAGDDGYATHDARVDSSGRLLVDGRPIGPETLVVNDYGTEIDLDGRVVAHPRPGLTAYRLPAGARVRSLATGLWFDHWGSAVVSYRAWPSRPSTRGFFRVVLSLPGSLGRRTITLSTAGATRSITLEPGETRTVRIPAVGDPVAPLEIRSDVAQEIASGTPEARLVAVRIPSISYGFKSGK